MRLYHLSLIVALGSVLTACGSGSDGEINHFSTERVASYSVVDETERCTDRDDPDLLLPDLEAKIRDVAVREHIGGRRVAFSSIVFNFGDGPFILQARTTTGEDGEPVTEAWQQIWKKDGTSCVRRAGVYEYHWNHSHFHFGDFNRYEIREGTDPLSGPFAGKTDKVSFCILDLVNHGGLARTVESDCESQEGIQGLSAGWGDIYDFSLVDQFIDLDTDPNRPVLPGKYTLVNIADPNDRVWEKNESMTVDENKSNIDFAVIDVPRRISEPHPTLTPAPTRTVPPTVTPVPTWTPFPTRTVAPTWTPRRPN